ncbi:MAG: 4-hydroxy-tetrahydrodipicolinate reductase [Candidatus Melainabacteria bacterium]|nr:MAG: 4-hydroxy-tetrahydrodipicolinate reductase [Candidatus Melainabacteria bacterium]
MDKETITVAIAGINGRMGRASAHAIAAAPDLKLVGAFGKEHSLYTGKSLDELVGLPLKNRTGILVSSSLADCLAGFRPDVLLDFTEANSAGTHALAALDSKVRPVIGTSGLTKEQLDKIEAACTEKNLGALLVPNFSVGAILMMNFAQQASKVFDFVEIVEMHHTRKLDAPSGTAMHTARKIAANGRNYNASSVQEREVLTGVRGGKLENGLRLHSLRLPGMLSHQEVLFGAEGELFTIRHDSFNTKCFEQGILMAIRAVMDIKSLVLGLDSFVLAKL